MHVLCALRGRFDDGLSELQWRIAAPSAPFFYGLRRGNPTTPRRSCRLIIRIVSTSEKNDYDVESDCFCRIDILLPRGRRQRNVCANRHAWERKHLRNASAGPTSAARLREHS